MINARNCRLLVTYDSEAILPNIPSSPCSCRPWVVIPLYLSHRFSFQGGIFNKQKCSMPGWACFSFGNSYIMKIYIYDQRLWLQIKKLSNNNANQNYIAKDTLFMCSMAYGCIQVPRASNNI